jgi:hypothetical protein
MAWTVRTPDGSLDFPTLADVERAYRNGLVAPDDEIREAGGGWMRAGDHPALRTSISARHPVAGTWAAPFFAVLIALGAIVCIALGHWGPGLALALAVTLYMFRLTRSSVGPTPFQARTHSLRRARARPWGGPR